MAILLLFLQKLVVNYMQQHKIKESWGYFNLIQGCMVMCIKIINCLCFQETRFSKTAAKDLSDIVSNYNLQHTYWANVVTDYLPLEQGCVGSLSNLGDFEISQMSCFAKFCKFPPCARVVIFRLDCEKNQ